METAAGGVEELQDGHVVEIRRPQATNEILCAPQTYESVTFLQTYESVTFYVHM